jgi:hypothetical protein
MAMMLLLLGMFASRSRGQSNNCCQIQVGGVNASGSTMTVPASASGPGGTYTSTETDTYPIACFNTATQKACSLSSPPNNVVTALGTGANVNDRFINCSPTFEPVTTQASPTSGFAATFVDHGTGYTGVNTTNGNCIQQNPQPFDSSSCVVVACLPKCFSGCGGSPIILDLNGKGFDLTDAKNGVKFDISGTGAPVQMGWIAQGADNAFLALPGADGVVHNGMQLFGDFTPQPVSDHPNGFAALAIYDDPKNGGNGDGVIDSRDAIFSSLRLWIDTNHDGICQPEELHTLPSLGVNSISLTYKLSEKTDQYGNVFRYRGKVNPDDPDASHVDRTAYDVFFVILDSSGTAKNILNLDGSKCAVPVPTKGGMLSTTSTLR